MSTAPAKKTGRTGVGLVFIAVAMVLAYFASTALSAPPMIVDYEAVSDGQGGAVIVWQEETRVLAQRVSSTGQILWASPTLLGENSTRRPFAPRDRPRSRWFGVVGDSEGGVFVGAYGSKSVAGAVSSKENVLVLQHVDASGRVSIWGESQDISGYQTPGLLAPAVTVTDDEIHLFDRSSIVKFPWQRKIPREEPAPVSVHMSRPLNRTGKNEWVVTGADGHTFVVYTEWVTSGVVEDILVVTRPSGDVMFVQYGIKNSPTRRSADAQGRVGEMPWGRYYEISVGRSAIVISAIQSGGGAWERTITETEEGGRAEPVAIADSAGYLVAWREWRKDPTAAGTAWADAVNPDGSARWPEPVKAFPDTGLKNQSYPVVISDGAGGAIVIVNSGIRPRRADEIRAQHISRAGHLLWGPEGILINK